MNKKSTGEASGSGYLSQQSGHQIPLAGSGEAPREPTARVASVAGGDSVSFRGFIKEMEARLAAEEASSMDEPQGSADQESGGETAQPIAAGGDAAAGNGSSDTSGESGETQRERIASSDSGGGAEPAYVFPRPERETDSFEDIFLYFPVQSGDMERLGVIQGVGNNSRFSPPQPSGLKSRAIFEQIER